MLVGNDFIPNVPFMHIHNNTLEQLYECYARVLPELGGYLNECGQLNLARLGQFINALVPVELDLLSSEIEDQEHMRRKAARYFGDDDDDDGDANNNLDLTLDEQLAKRKAIYYSGKLKFPDSDDFAMSCAIDDIVEHFTRALVWNLGYYYRGCPNWEWLVKNRKKTSRDRTDVY